MENFHTKAQQIKALEQALVILASTAPTGILDPAWFTMFHAKAYLENQVNNLRTQTVGHL